MDSPITLMSLKDVAPVPHQQGDSQRAGVMRLLVALDTRVLQQLLLDHVNVLICKYVNMA